VTFCDLASGECGAPVSVAEQRSSTARSSTPIIDILYVTDPVCSACWLMEPAWRKLLFHYGDHLNVRYVYGGLVPSWDDFHDRGAGIRKPADVAAHWAEVARKSRQPIDPRVWLDDPLTSSYPPSIAGHAVRLLAPEREGSFLRRVKEAVFLAARNISRLDVLLECAVAEGLDPRQFAMLYTSGVAERSFRRDLEEVQLLGVRTARQIRARPWQPTAPGRPWNSPNCWNSTTPRP
jgi:predicted DsbA family dithiol-disulfide isomerase